MKTSTAEDDTVCFFGMTETKALPLQGVGDFLHLETGAVTARDKRKFTDKRRQKGWCGRCQKQP